jgi:hypothetical protein
MSRGGLILGQMRIQDRYNLGESRGPETLNLVASDTGPDPPAVILSQLSTHLHRIYILYCTIRMYVWLMLPYILSYLDRWCGRLLKCISIAFKESLDHLDGAVHADSWSIGGGLGGEKTRASLLVPGASLLAHQQICRIFCLGGMKGLLHASSWGRLRILSGVGFAQVCRPT